jgi:hypothetical protein
MHPGGTSPTTIPNPAKLFPLRLGAPGFLSSHFELAVSRHCALSLDLQASVYRSPGNFDSKNAA